MVYFMNQVAVLPLYEVAHFYSIQCILDNNSPSAVVNQLKPDMITTGTGDDEDM